MEELIKSNMRKYKFRQRAMEKAIHKLMLELKDDLTRDGLIDTPTRVANRIAEYLDGQRYSNDEILEMFTSNLTYVDRATAPDVVIPTFSVISVRESDLVPYRLDVSIAYKNYSVQFGESKVQKLVSLCAKRLQTQEKFTQNIANMLNSILCTPSESSSGITAEITVEVVGHHLDGDFITKIQLPKQCK